ncbi:PP2C family protein-serine/threonine phosphatase [Streptomyces sp. NPDC101213]|uniref:PP2C family protein-serine/threonine phosphatase n=1 Tax=Streptomyces sp. NPDC101213 TaxID=3366130 RepID=UPI0038036CC8
MSRFVTAERALRTAAPHELVEAVRRALVEQYAALSVELLMADYGLTSLQPVAGPPDREPLSVYDSAAGRAFGAQEPYVEPAANGRVRAHLPVSVRGDRLGVLSVTLPEDPADGAGPEDGENGEGPEAGENPGGGRAPDVVGELAEVAQVLGHEVVVAGRATDLYLRARRRERLTLAAEMQWQLLPARAGTGPGYALGAQLEPAYAVRGDNFDWSATDGRLTLYVNNGTGEGTEAPLLTNLAVSALRNARRAGLPIADQAALADQAVHAHYRGHCYLPVLMLEVELATGRAQVVDAGSPRLLRLRAGTVEHVGLEAQLPLGMFEETDYVAQPFQVEPGDRLVFVSDGVHADASPGGGTYGDAALARAITATRLLPAAEAPHAVLRELAGHRDGSAAEDDALVVCLDWHGR